MSDIISYPTGLASMFAGHARTIRRTITLEEVTAAFKKAWNLPDGDENFVNLYHAYEQLKSDYEAQQAGSNA